MITPQICDYCSEPLPLSVPVINSIPLSRTPNGERLRAEICDVCLGEIVMHFIRFGETTKDIEIKQSTNRAVVALTEQELEMLIEATGKYKPKIMDKARKMALKHGTNHRAKSHQRVSNIRSSMRKLIGAKQQKGWMK